MSPWLVLFALVWSAWATLEYAPRLLDTIGGMRWLPASPWERKFLYLMAACFGAQIGMMLYGIAVCSLSPDPAQRALYAALTALMAFGVGRAYEAYKDDAESER